MSKRLIKTPRAGLGGKCVSCLLLLCVFAFGAVIILTTNISNGGSSRSKLNYPFSKEHDGFLGLKKLFSKFGESKSKNPRGTRKGLKQGTTKGKKKTEFALKNSVKPNIGDETGNAPKAAPIDEKSSSVVEAPKKNSAFQWPDVEDTMKKETKPGESKAEEKQPKDFKVKKKKPKGSTEKKPAQNKGENTKLATAGKTSKEAGKKSTKKESKIETKAAKTTGLVGNARKGSKKAKEAPRKATIKRQKGPKTSKNDDRTMSGAIQGQPRPKKKKPAATGGAVKGTKKAGD